MITMSHHYKYNRFREGGWGHRYKDLPAINKIMDATARHTQSYQQSPSGEETNPHDTAYGDAADF